ncbi:MAG TPA: hypothetical protein VKF40_20500, partial [Burkholderiales bacterium]|nr:hypothetical protein [Burkholderiales bacterium]
AREPRQWPERSSAGFAKPSSSDATLSAVTPVCFCSTCRYGATRLAMIPLLPAKERKLLPVCGRDA